MDSVKCETQIIVDFYQKRISNRKALHRLFIMEILHLVVGRFVFIFFFPGGERKKMKRCRNNRSILVPSQRQNDLQTFHICKWFFDL